MGCENNCKYEPDRIINSDTFDRCCERECPARCETDRCDNPIKVLSENVIWNGCHLRHLNLKPGDNLETALIEADRKMDNMERKFVELIDEYKTLSKKVYEQGSSK